MIDEKLKEYIIEYIEVIDIRFPFEWGGAGSDANNPKTDYSNPYVKIKSNNIEGVGIGFTLGKGNDLVCAATDELKTIVVGKSLFELISNFKKYWRLLANPFQSRWIGPVSGPYYMGAGAIANGLFDLWAKIEGKPLWELISELETDDILNLLDIRYVSHIISETEIRELLDNAYPTIQERKQKVIDQGLPCYYTTWIGTSIEDLIIQIENVIIERGIKDFKFKIGSNLNDDIKRLKAIREHFGNSINIMTDSNQVWSVNESIEWMVALKEFNITWIEEPIAPDLIDGHKIIKNALAKYNIDVVTGENCPNSHVAAQLISSSAVSRFQIDACRVIGPAENILIMLIAKKFNVPICPHAGGSGLDELVPHLSAWNYIRLNANQENVLIEQVGFCSEFFINPSQVENGHVLLSSQPGYIVGMPDSVIEKYKFRNEEKSYE